MTGGSRETERSEGDHLDVIGDAEKRFDPFVVERSDPAGAEPLGIGGQSEVIYGNSEVYEHTVVAHVPAPVVVDIPSAGYDQDGGFCDKALVLTEGNESVFDGWIFDEDEFPRLTVAAGGREAHSVQDTVEHILREGIGLVGTDAAAVLDGVVEVHGEAPKGQKLNAYPFL